MQYPSSPPDVKQSLGPGPEEFALTPVVVLRSVRKHWLLIAAFVLCGIIAGRLYTSWRQALYEAVATMQFDPQPLLPLGETVPAGMGQESYWSNQEYFATQHEILRSRAIAMLAVKRLGLEKDRAFIENEPGTINGPPVPVEAAAEVLRSRLTVKSIEDSRIAQVKYIDADPERARRVLDALLDCFVEQNLSTTLDSTTKTADWLDTQLVKLKSELEAQELALHEYKKSNNLLSVSYDDQSNMLRAEIQQLNTALTELKAKRQGLLARLDVLRKIRPKDAGEIPRSELLGGERLDQVRASYLEAMRRVAELKGLGRGENHPEMQAASAALERADKALMTELDNIKQGVTADLAALNQELAGLTSLYENAKNQALELNLRDVQYTQFRRAKDNTEKLFGLVLERSTKSSLSKLMHFNNVRVLDRPMRPSTPIVPQPLANLTVGLGLGLVFGLFGAVGRELLDRTIRSAEDAEQTLRLPLLGSLPNTATESNQRVYYAAYGARLPGKSRKKRLVKGDQGEPATELLVHTHPNSAAAEAARAIRTNLMFMSPDEPYRCLLVTSAGPREGKTTVASSIALAMAQTGQRVCLVDCDLRRPRIHALFRRHNDRGVSTALLDLQELDAMSLETEVPGLHVLPAGPMPPNPADLMQTESFARLLELLKERYDRVVIDSPPIGLVTDGVVISTRVDAVLLVLRMLETRRDAARAALRALQDVGSNCPGFVLNAAQSAGRYNYGLYYGAYPAAESGQEAKPAA